MGRTTVTKVLNEAKDTEIGVKKKPKKIPPQCCRPARIIAIVKKVAKDINNPNPPSQKQMAMKNGVSASTIIRIIDKDCDAESRRKYTVHALSDKQAQQRLERRPNFLKYLKGEKWKFILTIDEFWIYSSYVNGQSKVFYKRMRRGGENCDEWRKYCKQKHPKGVMCATRISHRGPTGMYLIPSRAKINADVYINNILQPVLTKDISLLYGKQKHVFHHDNAPAHQAKKTQEYLRKSRIKFTPKEHWLGDSPDLAPMDYAINGIFENLLFRKKPRANCGLERAIKTEGSKLLMDKIQFTLKSWKARVNLMLERKSYQLEYLL